MELQLRPQRVLFGLFVLVGALLVANVLGLLSTHYLAADSVCQKLVPLFDFRLENNFPSAYASLAILVCAGLLAFIAWSTRVAGRAESAYWLVLAGVFVFLACDELFAFHEHLIVPVRHLLHTSGLLHWPWMIPYGLGLLGLGAAYLPWLLRLPPRTRRLFIGSGIVFVSGAIVFEMLGARESERHGTHGAFFGVLYTLEELFEMLGIAFFIHALLLYIDDSLPAITIRTRARKPAGA